MFTTTRTNNQKFHLKDTSISNKTRGKCPLTTIIRKNLQFSRIIHNHYNIFVRRYGIIKKIYVIIGFGYNKSNISLTNSSSSISKAIDKLRIFSNDGMFLPFS